MIIYEHIKQTQQSLVHQARRAGLGKYARWHIDYGKSVTAGVGNLDISHIIEMGE